MHDKPLADKSGLTYPPDALVVKDTGFQGYEPPDTDTLPPKKKPRGRELHPIQKTINQVIRKARVTVEHAIAGIKRRRIVAGTFRNWRPGHGRWRWRSPPAACTTCGSPLAPKRKAPLAHHPPQQLTTIKSRACYELTKDWK